MSILYLMSLSRHIVCGPFHCDLKALNCLEEIFLRDGAMARLKLSQFRNLLGQALNGRLVTLLHGCSEFRKKAQSICCGESSNMRLIYIFKRLR